MRARLLENHTQATFPTNSGRLLPLIWPSCERTLHNATTICARVQWTEVDRAHRLCLALYATRLAYTREVVYQQTRRWLSAGVFEQMVHDLRVLLRLSEGRAPDPWATKLDCCTLQGTLVEFRSGDTRELDVPDGEFDAVVAHTLVNHVQEALTVLNEAARVVKPGGLITIFVGGLRIDDVRPGRSAREQNV
jgi:SAM-dependent methyltransferase